MKSVDFYVNTIINLITVIPATTRYLYDALHDATNADLSYNVIYPI